MHKLLHLLRHALAYIALAVATFLPGGILVHCVAAGGHAMIELAHDDHPPHGDRESMPGDSGGFLDLDSGCSDTQIDGLAKDLHRDRAGADWPAASELASSPLCWSQRFDAHTSRQLTVPTAVIGSAPPETLALRSIVLLI